MPWRAGLGGESNYESLEPKGKEREEGDVEGEGEENEGEDGGGDCGDDNDDGDGGDDGDDGGDDHICPVTHLRTPAHPSSSNWLPCGRGASLLSLSFLLRRFASMPQSDVLFKLSSILFH